MQGSIKERKEKKRRRRKHFQFRFNCPNRKVHHHLITRNPPKKQTLLFFWLYPLVCVFVCLFVNNRCSIFLLLEIFYLIVLDVNWFVTFTGVKMQKGGVEERLLP